MVGVLDRWYWIGAAVLFTNTVRSLFRGYSKPRPFDAADADRAHRYDIEVVDRWSRFTEFHGRDVLELGPGPDLGTGAEMLARGARSYLAIDAFPLARDVDPGFYLRFRPEGAAGLDYEVLPFETMGTLGRSFDLVVSNACLEHVPDVGGLFAGLHAILRPGGRMVHLIDAQTHSRPLRSLDPLNIYRFSDFMYGQLARYPGVPNRLLAEDYVDLASDAGFSTAEVVERRSLASGHVARIAHRLPARFRTKQSINKMSFFLLGTKPTTGRPSAYLWS